MAGIILLKYINSVAETNKTKVLNKLCCNALIKEALTNNTSIRLLKRKSCCSLQFYKGVSTYILNPSFQFNPSDIYMFLIIFSKEH